MRLSWTPKKKKSCLYQHQGVLNLSGHIKSLILIVKDTYGLNVEFCCIPYPFRCCITFTGCQAAAGTVEKTRLIEKSEIRRRYLLISVFGRRGEKVRNICNSKQHQENNFENDASTLLLICCNIYAMDFYFLFLQKHSQYQNNLFILTKKLYILLKKMYS